MIVNSRQHAEYASRFSGNVVIIPSVVDADLYRAQLERRSGPVRIGWSGSATTVPNLKVIAPVLRRIARRDDASLRLIGTDQPPVAGLPCEVRPWRARPRSATCESST